MTVTHNFNAGPAILPASVIAQVREELSNYQGTGISILESSHRSAQYETINQRAIERLKRILGLGSAHSVCFVQGGASQQFAMLPMNMLQAGRSGGYVLTGVWAEKAFEEAQRIGSAHIVASSKSSGYRHIPASTDFAIHSDAAYLHITSNNTIYGTQWHDLPVHHSVPLVIDASSDIASRSLDVRNVAMIYAGAQKNLGPSGVTVVIMQQDFLAQMHEQAPLILRYKTHAQHNSLYNTPPVFSVYMLDLVLEWVESIGMDALTAQNRHKAALIYDAIDQSGGFYRGHAEINARSMMNVVFRLPDEQLEKAFLAAASAQQMIGLAGHRSAGGIRASLYNALPVTSADALASFMREFVRTHG